ncbi:MAG: LytR C-terminal domain-containing protein, partial [Bifidobacterium sp.]|nr:LytR C-terminal domain-containing protein [Bifidobacterium sp.]
IRFPWTASQSSQTSSASASTSDSSSSATASDSSSASDSTSSSPSTSTSTTASQTVNKATSVRVINGTGTSGYAATKKAVLTQAGYSNVVADNPTGTLPSASVVWYQNETDKATAENVASTLGISTVSQISNISAPVVVVLMN